MDHRPIRFYHRGALVEVDGVGSTRTVLDWLRIDAGCVGTKEGCNEGDCGACTVVIGEPATDEEPFDDVETVDGLRLTPVNACIQFLPTLDGKALFTVDDLATGAKLHPVQQALVECHGSQCGFCTPGFVMSLWSVYAQHQQRQQQQRPRPGREQLADALSGNLCRCTGYRPILDAGQRMFDLPAVPLDTAPVLQALASLRMPNDGTSARSDFSYASGVGRFDAPSSVEALARTLEARPDATLLAGSTDIGLWVNKQFRALGDIVHLGGVRELSRIDDDGQWLRIGAGASLESAWRALARHFPELTEVWRRFASLPIRHAGTMGGNIANGSPIGDSAPVLLALDAGLVLRKGERTRELALDDFYVDYMSNRLEAGEFVQQIVVPLAVRTRKVRAYKISKRFDCDISAVCAGFSIDVDSAGKVAAIRLAFGGMAATVRRAAKAEAALLDNPWTHEHLTRAIDALGKDFEPLTDMRASADYRLRVARNLLQRFWFETRTEAPLTASAASVFSEFGELAPETFTKDRSDYASNAASRFDLAGETDASRAGERVGLSIVHESARLHVSGKAAYIDDLRELAGTLHAALGLAPVASGRIIGNITDTIAPLRELPDIVAVLTHADIPGANDCGSIVHDDPILCDGEVRYLGQPVFAVIAKTRDAARQAAARGSQWLKTEAGRPLFTPQAAHAEQRYVIDPMHLVRSAAADGGRSTAADTVRTAIDTAPHRFGATLEVGGQEQFYLEGQISYAIPGEDGAMHVHCSTQHPSEMQHLVAKALEIDAHRVQVECRRMGGGFGGKESQSALFACVAAIAARRLDRPVKLRLDRDDDFLITGRRHCFWYEYEVGHDDDGRILGVEVTMVSRAGHSADLSGPVMTRALCHFDNAYWLPEVAMHGYSARTNTQSNTAFRGFGGPQGAIAIENIIDTIARRIGRDPLEVRRTNFYATDGTRDTTPYGQPVKDNILEEVVSALAASSDYASRRREIADFNATSPILKRGLALTPLKFGISFNVRHFNQAGALVHVFTDGSILVNHGGTEMGQGLNTKVAQVVAHELGVRIDRVRVSATDTHKVANTSATAASTGADLNGKAAQDAARQIRERLAASAASRVEGVDAATVSFANDRVVVGDRTLDFDTVVANAYLDRVQLWSDGFYATPGLSWDKDQMSGHPFHYFAYGASVSEVIVDRLTGEWRLLRADILHDAGKSLNPAIDIGQIEGAFIQGMGWLTMEELVWHPQSGKLMTHAPSTYKIPTANDCPPIFNVRLHEGRNREDSIHRSKAVGEPPLLLPFSVFFAIRDAISAIGGHRIDPPLRAPATSEAILRAIDKVSAA